jgi:mono/diheme cytochrome c family protein
MRSRIVWTILGVVVLLIVIAIMRFNLTALNDPGRLETRVANFSTRVLISHASRQRIPARPKDINASLDEGNTQYGLNCNVCHGTDGRGQTAPGQWMYPRAADLTSKQVQNYSDREMFWIIENGIRFTGMPAFGKVETPDQIWDLVNYLRTLRTNVPTQNATK